MMPARLPPEILRQILRDATFVPDALDTSTEHILHEHRGALYGSLAASLATKRALSLTSRQFHALADEFLHDVLLLRSYAHIAPLLARLRAAPAPGAPARGWWVRRIDLDLGAGPVVEGPAISLLLVLCGRAAAAGELTGAGAETLSARV